MHVRRRIHACQMRRRIHACQMRRRIHACQMRRRIHAYHMRRIHIIAGCHDHPGASLTHTYVVSSTNMSYEEEDTYLVVRGIPTVMVRETIAACHSFTLLT